MINKNTFNHQDICSLLYSGNINGAVNSFREKTSADDYTIFTRTMYLSSLNFAIYNYILMKEGISLFECCCENEQRIAKVTKDSLIDTGINIISSYGMDSRYMIEKYQNIHIRNAIYHIHSHISEKLSLDNVSKAINLNPAYLCQLFKREVHMSFSDYITAYRVKLAKTLLQKSDYSIQEISSKCGFRSSTYLSTCYKKVYGYSPSKERR